MKFFGRKRVETAQTVWKDLNFEPEYKLCPKEGLGLVNGTAFSAGHASLVVFDAGNVLFLSLLATGMAFKCLEGNPESYAN